MFVLGRGLWVEKSTFGLKCLFAFIFYMFFSILLVACMDCVCLFDFGVKNKCFLIRLY